MPVGGKQAAEMVGATAGFHRDNTGWQLTNQRNQGVPPNAPAQNYCAGVIEADTLHTFLPISIPSTAIPMILSSIE